MYELGKQSVTGRKADGAGAGDTGGRPRRGWEGGWVFEGWDRGEMHEGQGVGEVLGRVCMGGNRGKVHAWQEKMRCWLQEGQEGDRGGGGCCEETKNGS